jgi:DNA mismatch repair protein MSH2
LPTAFCSNFLKEFFIRKKLSLYYFKWQFLRKQMSQDPAETNETLVSITGSFWIHIKNATRFIGFCFLDHQTFTLSLCQFQDDTSYTNLESLLVQIPLSECYGALQKKNESELIPLKKLMSRCQVVLHENILVNENEFDHMDSFKPFEFLLCPQDKPQQYSTSIQGMPYATKASYHLFYKTKLLQDSSQANQYFLKIVSNTQFVRLDTATLTALNIFPQNAQQKATPGNSLFGLLNTCRTLMGVTRLKMYLVQPLKNVNDICERQEIVKLFIQHADLKHILSSSFLRRLPNFDALSNKFHRALMKPLNATSICSLDDILHLYNGITDLYAILNLLVTLQEREPENSSKALTKQFIEPLQKSLHRFKRFNELVDYTFDPQERDNGRAVIHREFDITLKDLLEQKEHLLNSIEQHRCQVQSRLFSGDSKTSFDSQLVKLLECNMCEYVFRVKKKDQQILQVNFLK